MQNRALRSQLDLPLDSPGIVDRGKNMPHARRHSAEIISRIVGPIGPSLPHELARRQ